MQTPTNEYVDHWLKLWARYCRHADLPKLGYPDRSIPFASGGHSQRWSDWSEEELGKAEQTYCQTLDALIEGLPGLQQEAIRRAYLGERPRNVVDGNRWRDTASLLEQAAMNLAPKMQERGIP